MAKDITHVQSSEGKFQVFAPHYRFSLNIIQSPDLHCGSERTFHHNRCYERKFIVAQTYDCIHSNYDYTEVLNSNQYNNLQNEILFNRTGILPIRKGK